MKRRGPKVWLARQLGIALTPKAAKVMENRLRDFAGHRVLFALEGYWLWAIG